MLIDALPLLLFSIAIVFSVAVPALLLKRAIKKSVVPSGYNFLVVNVLGLSFTLIEISALQRLEYLKRCMKLNASDGFEFMRDDLIVSTDLIALHLRRWYLPRWFVVFRLRRLSAATIAELFRSCVTLSNLPFSIVKDEPVASTDDLDDEWDWIGDEDEKKKRPVVRQ